MWRFLTRRSHLHAHRDPLTKRGSRDRGAWESGLTNRIANIDNVGATAVATLTVTALSTSKGVALLTDLFSDVTHSGARSLVLDIQNLEYMDSVCLGCLVKALNHAVSGGGRIALVNTDSHMQDLFRVTRLDRLFPICHDVTSALATIEK